MSIRLKKTTNVNGKNDSQAVVWDYLRVSDERRDKILKSYKEWIEKDDSLQLMVFYQSQRITSKLWHELVDRHEEFKELDNYGRHLIGQRREKLMWINKINPHVGLRTQRLYADDFQKIYQDGVDLQNKLASKETNIRFLPVLSAVEDTGLDARQIAHETD